MNNAGKVESEATTGTGGARTLCQKGNIPAREIAEEQRGGNGSNKGDRQGAFGESGDELENITARAQEDLIVRELRSS